MVRTFLVGFAPIFLHNVVYLYFCLSFEYPKKNTTSQEAKMIVL